MEQENKHKGMDIGVLGDVHDNLDFIKSIIKKLEMENTILFQAGDFGVGFRNHDVRESRKEKKKHALLNEYLEKRNIFLYVVRGNHDNPDFFDGKHNLSNLIFMKDYDTVQVDDIKILGVGGAISVDRMPNPLLLDWNNRGHKGRTLGNDWWLDEVFVYDENKLNEIKDVDIVITHTAPKFAFPGTFDSDFVRKCILFDGTLQGELVEERQLVEDMFYKLQENSIVKKWYYGHFHKSHSFEHDKVKFQLLDIEELVEVKL